MYVYACFEAIYFAVYSAACVSDVLAAAGSVLKNQRIYRIFDIDYLHFNV